MQKITIDDYEIIAEEKDIELLNKIEDYFNNNKTFMKIILPKKISLSNKEDGYYYIRDFDSFIENIIFNFKNNKDFKGLQEDDNYTTSLYYNILLCKYDEDNNFDKKLLDGEENLYLSIYSLLYYCDNNDIIEFIKNPNQEEKYKLINNLKNKNRLKVYNKLLDIISDSLGDIDIESLKHLQELSNEIIRNSFRNIFVNTSTKNIELTSLDLDSLDNLFKTFLTEIDKSNEWLRVYDEAKENENIIFEKSKKELLENESFVDGKIHLYYNNNIYDFILLAREFGNYLNKNDLYSSLNNFPSIYFEKEAKDFLELNGFNKEEIDKLFELRDIRNSRIYYHIIELLNHLIKYKEKDFVSYEDLIDNKGLKYNTIDNAVSQLRAEFSGIFNVKDDKLKQITTTIDNNTITIIGCAPILTELYSCILGEYLTDLLSKDENKHEKIKLIMDNYTVLSPKDIIHIIRNDYKKYQK